MKKLLLVMLASSFGLASDDQGYICKSAIEAGDERMKFLCLRIKKLNERIERMEKEAEEQALPDYCANDCALVEKPSEESDETDYVRTETTQKTMDYIARRAKEIHGK